MLFYYYRLSKLQIPIHIFKIFVCYFLHYVYFCVTMKNEYYRDIIRMLLEQGSEGASVQEIARHIYNENYGLFEGDVRYNKIHRRVRLFLWHHVRHAYSPFTRIGWARYAIKPDFAIQLDFLDELHTPPLHPENAVAEEPASYNDGARQLLLFDF